MFGLSESNLTYVLICLRNSRKLKDHGLKRFLSLNLIEVFLKNLGIYKINSENV